MPRIRSVTAALLLSCLAACQPAPAPVEQPSSPVAAVQQLVDDLRRDDLVGYSHHAVPPALHARLEAAWSEGRTLWPLTELPLDQKFQGFLTTLAEPRSEQALLTAYRRQFAGAQAEIRTAATTLGLFTSQYVANEAAYSDEERDHYRQLIAALARWGQRAPLADADHARQVVPQITLAARSTGLGGPDGLRRAGMTRSLQRLGPFFVRLERALVSYGLDFDAALAGMRITLAQQTGEQARVRLQYTLAGQPIDAYVLLERDEGQWYLSDLLRRARTEAEAGGAEARQQAARAP
ncbi:hypothetical protein [Lysobacter solisilvae (ex Woo and Kim 2020)]|uniref:DUF3828 domain-containing protein n=1 Tax=Agrilutibacter terrestris TaxID=2865112 RepID=A0A7H0FTU8_9GAMM|nr:hypothetical protein [Lysobacter terrestris]QNP39464.1 hypothetical protein H8B22_07905 [Lysobacter terrestris]